MSKVSITNVRDFDVARAVKKSMELADYKRSISKGSRVLVKPNMCWDRLVPGCQTSPWLVKSVLEILSDRCSEVVVVEGDSNTHKAENALRNTKIGKVLDDMGIKFVNLTKAPRKKVMLKNPLFFKHGLLVPKIFSEFEHFVTLPVMKTHGQAKMTGALKNQYGCLQNVRATYHLHLSRVIADLNRAIRPAFAVMDGTIGYEENSPKLGRPKIMDLVLSSSDPVAIDSVAAYIMGFDPSDISQLRTAKECKIGENDLRKIKVVGARKESVRDPFVPSPGSDMVVKLNLLTLRFKWLKPLIYDTPVFWFMSNGAVVYNDIWYMRKGRGYLEKIIRTSGYGKQWVD